MNSIRINNIGVVIYIIATFISIWVNVLNVELNQALKSLPLVVLLILYLVSVSKINVYVLIALITTIIGKLLLFYDALYFELGSFLYAVSHLFCFFAVLSFTDKKLDKSFYINYLSFLVFFVIIYLFVLGGIKSSFFSLLFYGIAQCAFGAISFREYLKKTNTVNLMIFSGALIRVVSDSIFAINQFKEKPMIFDFLILSTYFIAHYLVFKGFILKQNNEVTK